MKNEILIEEIAKFFKMEGDRSAFGCDQSEIDRWAKFCEERYPGKGFCAVKLWSIVECECNEKEKLHLFEMGLLPFVLHTNHVIFDSRERWGPGSFASSYFQVSIEHNCLFVTMNTCYLLVGIGHRKSISPMLLAAIFEGLSA